MRRTAVLMMVCASCTGFGEADDKALVAAQASASLSTMRADEFRDYVLAADARQRAALERELMLIVELELRDVADSRSTVAVADAKRILEAVAAKRASILAQLDRERDAWLSDPKAREAERINAALVAYASARSEMARFVREITNGK